jgi:hypothetical protein
VDDLERFEFDRAGFLCIRGMLAPDETRRLAAAVDELEAYAAPLADKPPRKRSAWGTEYHHDTRRGIYVSGGRGVGQTLMIEDFWNAGPAFDPLVNHARTMSYIRAAVRGRCTINNSEIRLRYSGNATGMHMGGPVDPKYRYAFTGGAIDCMMVRVVYFLHDVPLERGTFCVVPGTHKSNIPPPYGDDPAEDPAAVGLEVAAGDAILFTENLRHGGLVNRSSEPRKTIHVGYGPAWMMSQNISTMDEPPNVTDETRSRWTADKNDLFRAWPARIV